MAKGHKIEIDKKQFENLCALQCTKEEICGWFGCSNSVIEKWCKKEYGKPYAEVYRDKRGLGKISLRRYQWKQAQQNSTMAIWLGKQYLGQKEPDRNEAAEALAKLDEVLKDIGGVV